MTGRTRMVSLSTRSRPRAFLWLDVAQARLHDDHRITVLYCVLGDHFYNNISV